MPLCLHRFLPPTTLPALLTASFLCTSAAAQPEGDLRPVPQPRDNRVRNPIDDRPAGQPAQPNLLPAPTSALEFSEDHLYLSEHGLRLPIPLGWIVERSKFTAVPADVQRGDRRGGERPFHFDVLFDPLSAEEITTYTLFPPDSLMVFRLHTPSSLDESAALDILAQGSAQKVIDAAAAGTGAPPEAYAIFERDSALVVAGRDAYRFYMRVPRRVSETGLVIAHTLIDLAGPNFLVLEMICPEENYLAARPHYETLVAALEFLDPAEEAARRWPLMLAASRLIATRTPEHYQAAMTSVDGRMERLYNPAGNGDDADDRERGVRRVLCWTGPRGEIDPEKPRDAYAEIEKEEGYIVFVGGRYFDSAEDPITGERRRVIADYAATYWMSYDRQREGWLNRMVIQTPLFPRPATFSEVGARDGADLTVWTRAPGEPETVVRPVFEEQGYLSQVEFFLFADMLAQAGFPTEFGYYTWQTGASTCRFIHDSVQPESEGLGWTIERSFGDDAETHHLSFDGELRWRGTLREVGHSLTRGEPTDYDRISALWRAKNLPMTEIRDPGPRRR